MPSWRRVPSRVDVENLRMAEEKITCNLTTRNRELKTLPSVLVPPLGRLAKSHRYQLGNSGFLHGDSIQYRRNSHSFLAVSDENKLGLHTHLFHQFREAPDVSFVKRSIDLVEDAERAGLVLEDADQQGQRGQSFLPAG